jgi:hypothetical protein
MPYRYLLLIVGLWACTLDFLTTAAVADEPPVPLEQVPVDIYRLRDWGRPKYDVYMAYTDRQRVADVVITERDMRHVATHSFTTEVRDDEIIFRQYWLEPSLKRGGAQVTYHCRKDAFLSLARMEVQRDARTYQVDVTDGQFDLEFLGKTRSGAYPERTLTDAALMRLVTLLPREPGKRYSVGQRTFTPEINVLSGPGSVIECLGPDTITLAKQPHECTKYACGEVLLWVRQADHRLLRYEVPGWKILVLHEATAAGE